MLFNEIKVGIVIKNAGNSGYYIYNITPEKIEMVALDNRLTRAGMRAWMPNKKGILVEEFLAQYERVR